MMQLKYYIYIFFYFQTILVNVNKHTIIQDLLESVCGKRQLNLEDHYVRVKLPNTPAGVIISRMCPS
jgi:hypothetical protein